MKRSYTKAKSAQVLRVLVQQGFESSEMSTFPAHVEIGLPF